MITLNHFNFYNKANANFGQTQQKRVPSSINTQDVSFTSNFIIKPDKLNLVDLKSNDIPKSGLQVVVPEIEDANEIAKFLGKIRVQDFGETEYEKKSEIKEYSKNIKKRIKKYHIVKDKQGRIIGSIRLSRTGPETGVIWEFAIKQDKRGKHIGTELLKHVIEDARKANYNELFIFTKSQNVKRMYENVGFEEVSEKIPRKLKKDIILPKNTIVMRLDLKPSNTAV